MVEKKSMKIETFAPSPWATSKAELEMLTHEFQRTSEMLFDAGRWFHLKAKDDPAGSLDDFIHNLRTERDGIMARIDKLKTDLAKLRPVLPEDARIGRAIEIPGMLPDPLDPRFMEAIMMGRWFEEMRSLTQEYKFITPRCTTLEGVAMPSAIYDREVIGPYDPNTSVNTDFTNIDGPNYIQVDFVDQSIQSTLAGDTFTATRIMDFALPKAPCKGTLQCRHYGGMAITPNIVATSGRVTSKVQSLLHLIGDGIDPLDPNIFWRVDAQVACYQNAGIGEWCDEFPEMATITGWQSIELEQDDIPVFHIAVTNIMYVFQGTATFKDNGVLDLAYARFYNAPWVESDAVGVWWHFDPATES